jgi:4-hydroxy-tetrahydrodipicolinate synthase
MNYELFRGGNLMDFGKVITAMITPFDKDGNVDYNKAQFVAEHLLANGSDSLVVAGTTGESPTLSHDEKLKLFAAIKEVTSAKKGAYMIAGTGSNDTAATAEFSRQAEKAGADAVLTVVPYYNKPPQEGLYQHFATIAAATELPVVLYNVPVRTITNMTAQTVIRLAQIDNIVALKEAHNDMEQVKTIREGAPADFAIYSGDDAITLPMMKYGARGVVSVASHIVGNEIKAMIEAYNADDMVEAERLHDYLMPVFKKLFIVSSPIPLKYCLEKMGFGTGDCRLPLCTLAEAYGNPTELDAMLIEYGII